MSGAKRPEKGPVACRLGKPFDERVPVQICSPRKWAKESFDPANAREMLFFKICEFRRHSLAHLSVQGT